MRRKPNLKLGLFGGAFMGVFLSAIALAIVAIRGTGVLERLGHLSLGTVIATYLAGGLAGGAIFGLLLPLTTWRWGAVVVGTLVAAPFYFGIGFVLGNNDFLVGAICSVFIGGGAGAVVWTPPRDGTDEGLPPEGVS
jgi:hypothetical protein